MAIGLDTENNWVWMSDYPFGGIVFHYGRWVWIESVGWAWVPGRRYAPAWVVWRVPSDSYDYVGWAPAPPDYGWLEPARFGSHTIRRCRSCFLPSYYMFPAFRGVSRKDRYFASTLASLRLVLDGTGIRPRLREPDVC